MQAYAQQSRVASNGAAQVVSFDVDHLWVDPAQSGGTIGNAFPTVSMDGLHPSVGGAFLYALAEYNVIKNWASPNVYMPNSQSDVYNASNNPAGNLLGTSGLMLGTTGTASGGCTTSSGVATSWQVNATVTGTLTCTGTLETTRTDGLAGQRQIITISDTGGGASEKVAFANYTNYSVNLTLGTDQIYGQADIDLSNLTNVEYVGCQLLETAPTSQQAISQNSGSVTGYRSTRHFLRARRWRK